MNELVVIEPPASKLNQKKLGEGILNPNIPQLPFTCIIEGPRHRGKTVLLNTLLSTQKGMYGSFFKKENIILYSPTYSFDDTLHALKLKHVFSPPHKMTDVLNDVMNQQEKLKENNAELPVLIVMEDITQIADAWKCLEHLGYTGRHFNVHTLAIGHKMSSIPRGVRTQTTTWILFRPNEQSEWQWVLDMFSRKKTQALWLEALRRCWDQDFQFVYIDFERKLFSDIYRCGFNASLFTPEEETELDFRGVYYDSKVRKQPRELEEEEVKEKRNSFMRLEKRKAPEDKDDSERPVKKRK